jgi:hypothetical protein
MAELGHGSKLGRAEPPPEFELSMGEAVITSGLGLRLRFVNLAHQSSTTP